VPRRLIIELEENLAETCLNSPDLILLAGECACGRTRVRAGTRERDSKQECEQRSAHVGKDESV
jgi:hypothetical protein